MPEPQVQRVQVHPLPFAFPTRGIGTAPPSFQRTKSALFCDESALFVQANVAVNTKLTLKVPFSFGNFQVF